LVGNFFRVCLGFCILKNDAVPKVQVLLCLCELLRDKGFLGFLKTLVFGGIVEELVKELDSVFGVNVVPAVIADEVPLLSRHKRVLS
jgi:hypothetical protein